MRLLVTGAGGFIGSHVTEVLHGRGPTIGLEEGVARTVGWVESQRSP